MWEIFKPRQKEIFGIHVAASPAELLPLLKRGASVAVCEMPALPIDPKRYARIVSTPAGLSRSLLELDGAHTDDAQQLELRESRSMSALDSILHFQRIHPQDAFEIRMTHREIYQDIKKVLAHFPGYMIEGCYLGINIGAVDSPATVWHKDGSKGRRYPGQLRAVRSVNGPTTEYSHTEGGHGREVFKHGSLAVHKVGKNGAWHRTPAYTQNQEPRITYALWLKPKS